MTTISACPDQSTWLRFLEEQVHEPELSVLGNHLDACPACTNEMGRLAGSWSLDGGRHPAPLALATATHNMLQELAANPDLSRAADAAAFDRLLPEIPGLTDFVRVGQGGMGVVYRAQEINLNRTVAVKVMSGSGLASTSSRLRAEREALTLARLQHPNVVQIFRSGEANGFPYLIMEWIQGGTLQDRICQKPLDPMEAATLVRDLALAIGEAHALGIIHRDIKPDNVLMMPSSRPDRPPVPKLADFGLSRPDDATPGLTGVGLIVGTPSYIAPEQTSLDSTLGEVGPATDIHGLGATLYALISGQPPYNGQTSRESLLRSASGVVTPLESLCHGLSLDLKTIVEKCLQHSPQRRYRSAGDLADDLTRFLAGEPILARPISKPERLAKWARRKPLAAAVTLLLGLGGIAGIVGTSYHLHSISFALTEKDQALDTAKLAVELGKRTQDQLRASLGSLTNDVVDRMIQRGPALDAGDRDFLRSVREMYLKLPLEFDPLEAHKYRANGLFKLANLFFQIEQYDEVHTCAKAALADCDAALALDPEDRQIAKMRLKLLLSDHHALFRSQRFPESEQAARRLIDESQWIAQIDPASGNSVAHALISLGINLAETNRSEEAIGFVSKGIALFEQIRRESPDNDARWHSMAMGHYNAALCLSHAGQPEGQKAQLLTMLSVAEEAAQKFPAKRLNFLNVQQIGLGFLAGTYLREGRLQESKELVDRALTLSRIALESQPDQALLVKLRDGLIDSAILEYEICKQEHRPLDAEAALQEAVQAARQNRLETPAIYYHSHRLMESLRQIAALFEQTNQAEAARRAYEEIIEVARPWLNFERHTTAVRETMNNAMDRLISQASLEGNHGRVASLTAERIQQQMGRPDEQK